MNLQACSPQPPPALISQETEKPYHKHCPLCVDSMVHPEDDNRTPAIIFLDMDEVMIADRIGYPLNQEITLTLRTLFPYVKISDSEYEWLIAKARHLNPHALRNLHSLIERIEASGQRALVVLSSAWRNEATLQQHREEAFAQHQFCKYLCGKTAPMNKETECTPECKQGFSFKERAEESFGINLETRADVIKFWLRDHGFDLISTNFIVIDDDPFYDLKKFEERLIQTYDFFRKEHLEQATKFLKI